MADRMETLWKRAQAPDVEAEALVKGDDARGAHEQSSSEKVEERAVLFVSRILRYGHRLDHLDFARHSACARHRSRDIGQVPAPGGRCGVDRKARVHASNVSPRPKRPAPAHVYR